MNKKSIMLIASAVALATTCAATTAVYKDITVQMGGITVTYLGEEVDLKDATGASVEPMIYNGTTYLPVRSVAETAGLEVEWIGDTSTVALNGTTVKYLDEMPCVFESTYTDGSKFSSVGEVRGFDFSRALYIRSALSDSNDNTYPAKVEEVVSVYYTLDQDYKTFVSTIKCDEERGYSSSIIKIYGDGELLYNSPGLTKDSLEYDIEADIEGVTKLCIEITSVDEEGVGNYDSAYRDFYFGEARVVK